MKALRKLSLTLTAAALAACSLAACVAINYDGERKTPKMKRSDVQVFYDKSKIPVKGYKIMGNADVSAPPSYTASEAELKLVDYAKECGADGVLILSVERTPDGTVRNDQLFTNDSKDNKGKPEEAYKVKIKAQLLEFPKAVEPDDVAAPARQSK